MKGETRERWEKLCQRAADEQNPEELLRLVTEINRLLTEKEKRLKAQQEQSNEGKNWAAWYRTNGATVEIADEHATVHFHEPSNPWKPGIVARPL
jgi:hypothetical protein